MKGAPKITVVTPSYNQGRFIGETIESVLSQEGDFFLEYIIVDGGSTDETVEVIKKYERLLKEKKYPVACKGVELIWKSEKDRGQVDAIEKGFAIANGEIGSWLNSDDVFLGHGVLQRVMEEFDASPELGVVTGDGFFIDIKGRPFGAHKVDRIDFAELLYLDYHILQPATFLRREIYKRERLDRSYNCCFDAEYFIRLMLHGVKFRKLGEPLAGFRIYPEIKTIADAGRRYRESLMISRLYGKSSFFYAVSYLYKYFEIVLNNRYPGSLMKKLTWLMRFLSYRLVAGRERWEIRRGY